MGATTCASTSIPRRAEYVVDGSARPLVVRSFADLLSKYFEQAQMGEIDVDEDLD